jgi:putative membrane protein
MPSELPTNHVLPLVNACLNAMAALFLLIGFFLIRKRNKSAHLRAMLTAFVFSSLFLLSYLWYHTHYASSHFGGEGFVRYFYFGMLISHVLLAVVIVPLAARLLWLAYHESFSRHAQLARVVWPVWMYVSVTGVLIYLMLYQWYPSSKIPLEVLTR